MSSEMFETLEEELSNLNESIEQRIIKLSATGYGEMRKKLMNELERDLQESASLLQQLESEGRMAPHGYRAELMSKVRKQRESLGKLKGKLGNTVAQFGEGQRSTGAPPRQIILEGRTILERTSDSIMRSQAVAIETEQIGNEVVGELGTQRETLLRTKGRLHDTDVEISKSRRILRSMYLNVIYNKLILIGIIIIEVCILGVVIYLKFK